MAIVLALAAMLLVFGSVLWFKPSKTIQHQSMLRTYAYQSQWKLRSAELADISDRGLIEDLKIRQTLYVLPHQQLKALEHSFAVQKTLRTSGAFLPDGWQWLDNRRTNSDDPILNLVQQLPEYVTAFFVEGEGFGFVLKEHMIDKEKLDELKQFCLNNYSS